MKILDVPQSGSIHGVTSSRNRYGQYRRTKAQPVNPNTTKQTEARTRFAEGSQAWRGLTEAQRAGWIALAAQRPVTDRLGQTQYLTGAQTFVGAYCTASVLGSTAPTNAPANPSIIEDRINNISATSDGTIEVDHADLPVGQSLLISLGGPVSAGRSYHSDFRLLGTIAAGEAAGTVTFSGLNLPLGSKVFIRATGVVSNLSGPSQDYSKIVVAPTP